MKKTLLIVFALFVGLNIYGQRQRDRMGNPIIQRQPNEQDIEKYKKKIEERKQEFIVNFLTTLEGDDFQKEIIKQYINSYFDEKQKLSKIKFEHAIDRNNAIKKLDDSHFAELEELISENDMSKIKEMIKGGFKEQEVIKEKKKKRKKRKKDKG